jgi:hypothetical protein
MKLKLILATAILGTVLALPGSVSAQAPAGDSVTGTLFDFPMFEVFPPLDVRSGPAGENPTGTAGWHAGGGLGPTWRVDVTCLAVDGKTAVFGFSGSFFGLSEGGPVAGLARVTDGGGPGSGLDSFEWAQVAGAFGGPPIPGPTDCSSYPAGFQPLGPTAFNRVAGDIVIIDTPALPTSKGQCRDGGWQQFGFKNQGECIAFVERGPGPEASGTG